MDGLGNGNDTLTFDLLSSAFTGSNFNAGTGDITLGAPFDYSVGGTLTSPSNQHFGPNSDLDTNESFQVSIQNVSYTSADGPDTVSFNGFNEINVFATAGATEIFYLGTTGATTLVPGAVNTIALPGNPQVLTLTATENSNRFRDLDFSFEVTPIPEPSSFMFFLSFLSLLVLGCRRRRSLGTA